MKKSFLMIMCLLLAGFIATAQTQYYSGTSDGDKIRATLIWNTRDATVKGSYYFISNPNRVFRLSGTNYVDGEIEITESLNGKRTGNGTLYKTLTKSRIIWSGDIQNTDGTQSSLYLTRSK
jgi:hypothetical protein